MEHLFLTVLNMSLTASYIILAVLLLRLCLRRAPKKYSYALWGVVGFRLLCPFSFSSVFSLFSLRPFDMTAAQAAGGAALTYLPQDLALMETPQVTTGLPFLNAALNPSLPAAAPAASANPLQIWLFVGAVVWLVGVCGFLLYALLSALRLRRALRSAVRYEGDPTGQVYCSGSGRFSLPLWPVPAQDLPALWPFEGSRRPCAVARALPFKAGRPPLAASWVPSPRPALVQPAGTPGLCLPDPRHGAKLRRSRAGQRPRPAQRILQHPAGPFLQTPPAHAFAFGVRRKRRQGPHQKRPALP